MLGRIINGYIYAAVNEEPRVFVRRPVGIEGEHVTYIRKVEQIPDLIQEEGLPMPKVLLLEDDNIFYGERTRCAGAFSSCTIKNGSPLIRDIRKVKTPYEIEQMRVSARLHSEAIRQIPGLYREGMTETQFAVEVEHKFRQMGSLGLFRIYGPSMEAFMGQTMAGDNAGAPSPYDFGLGGAGVHPSLPVGDSGLVIEKGMSVMVDVNGNFTGYISDQTRTFSVGKLPQRAYDIHNISLEIQNELSIMGKPGVTCESLYHKALEIVSRYKVEDIFMGKAQQSKFVGHGIGLVINELPVLCDRNKDLLESGELIAIEPKLIIDGVGAVGTENSFLVTDNGLERLTSAPEEIIDLTDK